jgi:group II intron reverse transcriptase/maturase/CRISPR-associated endonuclease Cas1
MMAATRLQAYHSGVLYAMLANAYGLGKGVESVMPDGMMPDAVEQCRTTLKAGEEYAFGLRILALSAREARGCLQAIVSGLSQLSTSTPHKGGHALGGNFEVARIDDLVAGCPWDAGEPHAIPEKHFEHEQSLLQERQNLTLRFVSPLRSKRPKKYVEKGGAFFDGRFFHAPAFLRRAHARVGNLGWSIAPLAEPLSVDVTSNELVWLDMTYGPAQSRKALGGAVGRVRLRIEGEGALQALVRGQYVGSGEATSFGLGCYRIEELGVDPYPCERAQSLLELAFHGPGLDKAAERYQIESGQMRVLAETALKGTYQPKPPYRFELRQSDGRSREIAVPEKTDRALQQAVLAVVAPALDLFFEESSLAYRKGLGRTRAAQKVRQHVRDGYQWALKADFYRFFDSIDHEKLERRVSAYLGDSAMTALLMAWVRDGAPEPGRGLPTGSPISPLLANLFLDCFDERIEEEGGRLVRYADDFLVLFRSEEEARRVYSAAREEAEHLQLALNEEKSGIVSLREPFTFLGFRFHFSERWMTTCEGAPRLLSDLGWSNANSPAAEPGFVVRLRGESRNGTSSLHVTGIAGPGLASLEVSDGHLVCAYEGGQQSKTRLNAVESIVLLDPPQLSAHFLRKVSEHELVLYLADPIGRLRAVQVPGVPTENPELIMRQVLAQHDPEWRLAIARKFVAAKLKNYAALADALGSAGDLAESLRSLAERSMTAESHSELLGVEGSGGAKWYGRLGCFIGEKFKFHGRVAPDADDPINVLLNIAQTTLHRFIFLCLLQSGCSTSLGFLHEYRQGHAALASDIQEPFRYLMDRVVIEASHHFNNHDFHENEEGPFRLAMRPAALREFHAMIWCGLSRMCGTEDDEPRPYRQRIRATVRAMRRHLMDRNEPLRVFVHP